MDAQRMKASHVERALGSYLGLAVGDALGATVEFMTPREIHAEFGVHNRIRGGGWLKLKPGAVTDDTTMSLALGESIIKTGHVDAQAAAEAFDQWMRGKPVDIGNTVRRGLIRFRRTGKPEMPYNEQDAGNGACMRCLPVALATLGLEASSVRDACRLQAHVTHNHELSDAATECIVLMIQDAIGGASMLDLFRDRAQPLIADYPEFGFRRVHCTNPTGYIVPTIQAVFQALFDTESFEACLVDVVNRGGDADTTGAIAGMVAGAVYGKQAIPRRWLRALDQGVAAACEQQAFALLSLDRDEGRQRCGMGVGVC